jgi:rare lipoprotein A (peptidoglycan hydrolase)
MVGIREVNNTLGYTRVVETGFAEAIDGDGNSKKHLCLHKTAPIGSILQVRNEMNGQSVFVKVVGKLPETGSNEKLIIRISRQAYDRLMATGKRFPVEVSYPESAN